MDALDGLFALTDWARLEVSERAAVIADAIGTALTDFGHVQGVILSSGASVNLDEASEPLLDQRGEANSSVMLRRLIAPGLLRETAIVTLRPEAECIARLFTHAYNAESRGLTEDLSHHGWSLTRMLSGAPSG